MNTTAGAIFGYIARCVAPVVHGKKTVCGTPALDDQNGRVLP